MDQLTRGGRRDERNVEAWKTKQSFVDGGIGSVDLWCWCLFTVWWTGNGMIGIPIKAVSLAEPHVGAVGLFPLVRYS